MSVMILRGEDVLEWCASLQPYFPGIQVLRLEVAPKNTVFARLYDRLMRRAGLFSEDQVRRIARTEDMMFYSKIEVREMLQDQQRWEGKALEGQRRAERDQFRHASTESFDAWTRHQEMALVRRLHNRSRYAIVMPFMESEIPYMERRFSALSGACLDRALPVELVLMYTGNNLDIGRKWLESGIVSSISTRCFRETRAVLAPAGTTGHHSACVSFSAVFRNFSGWGFDSFYWMEADVSPTGPGWLDGVMDIFLDTASHRAWVIGGVWEPGCIVARQGYNGPSPRSPPYHINGNAFYSCSLQVFKLVAEHRVVCDHYPSSEGWERFIYMHPRAPQSMFRADKRFIQCRSSRGDHATLPFAQLRVRYPAATLVHHQ